MIPACKHTPHGVLSHKKTENKYSIFICIIRLTRIIPHCPDTKIVKKVSDGTKKNIFFYSFPNKGI